jgi:molybdate/tungstate transport system substrate-binding protein
VMTRGIRPARVLAPRLVGLILVAVFLVCACVSGCGAAKEPVSLRVIYPGSLLIPFPELQKQFEAGHPGVKIESEAHGSIQVLRQVSDIHQKADVLISADVNLIPLLLYHSTAPDTGRTYADWYVEFATNEMAIAYTDKSAHATEITSDNWYEVVTSPGVRVGIADPRFDANGYRALMVLKLAEAVYGRPTLFFDFFDGKLKTPITSTLEGTTSVIHVPEIVETRSGSSLVMRGYSVQLLPLLETGDIDYAIEYLSVIKQHGLKYVTLPPTLNLGSREDADAYGTVKVRLDYQRFASVKPEFPGETIGYGAAIPSDAPHPAEAADFLAFLVGPEGRRVLASYDHPTLDPPESDHPELLPPVLKELCAALR